MQRYLLFLPACVFSLLLAGCGQQVLDRLTVGSTVSVGAVSTRPKILFAPTPQMGWTSWPGASCPTCYNGGSLIAITEPVVKAESANLANASLSGLCAVEYPPTGSGCVSLTTLGYNYVAIDATWDQCETGSPPCTFEPVAAQFPDGISGVAAYAHANGQLVSLYGSSGLLDCVNYPAQFQHEVADITLAAGWGIDEFRSDWCPSGNSIYGRSQDDGFAPTGIAIQNAPRIMGFDVNDANLTAPSWFQSIGGTRVRIGEDNPAGFWYAKAQGSLSFAIPYQNKGHWLDFDVMMGGLSENMQRQTVSDAEARAQFNFYAIVASPILIGNLIENLDSYNLQTYANSEVIAINQDSLGVMGTLVSTSACGSTVCQVWSRLLANGNYAICLINYDPSAAHSIPVTWSMFGQSGTLAIRDLWAHASEGSSSTGYTFSAPPWGSTMLVISQYGKR